MRKSIGVETMSEKSVKTQNGLRKTKLPEKKFETRDSALTQRYEHSQDVKTIYNLFAIILISLLTNTVVHDYSKTKQLHFGFRLIVAGFNQFHLVVLIWCLLNVLAFFTYFCFKLWTKTRFLLGPKRAQLWDRLWLSLAICYYILSLFTIQKVVTGFGFAAGSAGVLLLEEVRLLMKQHAFVRTNITRILQFKPHTDQTLATPGFWKFLYFLFAPTFIYRDEYPRTPIVRWRFVLYNLGEVLGIIWLLSLVVERFLIPPFEEMCLRPYTWREVLIPVVANTFPGILFMLCGFYSVLHSCQNAFAEMLRFGDRMFYKEWWTCRSLSEYFRTWNVVVHDWLFTYIYKDMYELVVPGNKPAAKLAVFTVSALIHEWILTAALGLFLPIQFAQFFLAGGVLALFNILDLPVGNLMVWYCIVLGSGIQVNLYTLEYFARRNCPQENISVFDFYKPRFVTCGCVV